MPEHYYLIADLALIACPQEIQRHDDRFKKTFRDVLFTHDLALQKLDKIMAVLRERGLDVTCQWAFSTRFENLLWGSFPYNHLDDMPWVSDLMIELESFFHRIQKNFLSAPEGGAAAELTQEWLPNGIDQELSQCWLELVAMCLQSPDGLALIASSDRIADADSRCTVQDQEYELKVLHIATEWMDNLSDEHRRILNASRTTEEFFNQVGIFKLFEDWQIFHHQVNPWAKANLPLTGAVYYVPARSWRPGDRFPAGDQCNFRPCFMDQHGRNWEWDRTEKHWDVQNNPPKRDCYFNVSPEGVVLHVHGDAKIES
jgi:hypothetical protein